MELLRNGRDYDEVTLNAGNGWKYTWTDLDDRYNWSVAEVDVPGFASEVSHRGTIWTITNDDVPAEPVDPVKPVDPVDPVNPVDPVEPVDPVDPAEPTDLPEPEIPTDPVPQTGDETNLNLWLAVLGISALGIITTLVTVRPRYHGKRYKR